MTQDKREGFIQKLREYKNKYINGLPTKIAEIQLLWNQLNTNDWRLAVLLKMQNLSHNIAGSGGTFGFPNLSSAAKNLENALEDLKSNGDVKPEMEKLNVIEDLLIELQQIELQTIRENESMTVMIDKPSMIYILDQDAENSLNMLRQLMIYGCNVKTINRVEHLEQEIRKEQPLIILIDADFADLQLNAKPVMQVLRKDLLLSCPIVYLASRDDFESRMQAIKATANAYFTKPVDVALLVERINTLTNVSLVEPYRIMIVEDDTELANFYALTLEKGGMKVVIESNPEHALENILETNPELVVLDLYMPNYNGIDLIKLIRQHQSLFTLPIVLLTSETNINLQFLAREVGVDDFMVKPIEPVHLYESVLNRVQRARYTNASMSKDSLTGLFSHKKIYEYLRMQLEQCERYGGELTYAILDLDNFKHINDTYGHLVGDNILIAVSNALKAEARASDFIGRYGGEEFVIIYTKTSEKDAFSSLERLRKMFEKLKHYSGGDEFSVTFSAGIASYPKHGDLDTIMAVADEALYSSKNTGKNKITIG